MSEEILSTMPEAEILLLWSSMEELILERSEANQSHPYVCASACVHILLLWRPLLHAPTGNQRDMYQRRERKQTRQCTKTKRLKRLNKPFKILINYKEKYNGKAR